MPSDVSHPTLRLVSNAERPSEVVVKAAARLRVIRAILDQEQTQIADACGVSSQRWSNWENGAHLPDVLVMVRASMLFGFTLDWIYKGAIDRMPYEFVAEIQRRRPDLVLGAAPGAEPAADWDELPAARRRGRRPQPRLV
jgi:transcriptional regulator with XRE-family HTH domain